MQKKPCSKSYTLCHVNFQDFSRTTGKQEPTSGLASQQLSRLPSDEHLCLSPPWNEEDDGPVGVSYILLFTIRQIGIYSISHSLFTRAYSSCSQSTCIEICLEHLDVLIHFNLLASK